MSSMAGANRQSGKYKPYPPISSAAGHSSGGKRYAKRYHEEGRSSRKHSGVSVSAW